jgi:hypothetical protein
MIPKVGQLLKWYDNFDFDDDNNDVGIVKEVQLEGENFFGDDEYQYVVVVDWCKGPHHSFHDQEEWEESISQGEIVPVE